MKKPEEMARLFVDLPEAIANTEVLSSRLKFNLKECVFQGRTFCWAKAADLRLRKGD